MIMYIPVCKIWIQYTNYFKRYQTEIIYSTYGLTGHTEVRTDSGDTIYPPPIENAGVHKKIQKK